MKLRKVPEFPTLPAPNLWGLKNDEVLEHITTIHIAIIFLFITCMAIIISSKSIIVVCNCI